MRREILEPADVGAAALAELKTWLGISRPNEDDLLVGLLQASLDMCEAFTGQAPMAQLVEERVPVQAGRYGLASMPITSLEAVEIIDQDGSRSALQSDHFNFELQAFGRAAFSISNNVDGQAIALQLRVGNAPGWDAVPAAIKQGLIRLSAHNYRDRDRAGNTKKDLAPPSSVTALWRPWRAMRLQ